MSENWKAPHPQYKQTCQIIPIVQSVGHLPPFSPAPPLGDGWTIISTHSVALSEEKVLFTWTWERKVTA